MLVTDDPMVSNRLYQDLAGSGVSLPVMLALLMSTFRAVSWAQESTGQCPATQEEVESVFALLASLHG